MLENLLIYRLLLTNGLAAALLVYAWAEGWVDRVVERDVSGISIVIFALFMVGLVSTFVRGWKVSRAINERRESRYPLTFEGRLRALKMPAKNLHIYKIAEYLVTLGLIGNALGFFLALEHASSGQTEDIAGALLSGMGVAFGSTLVGSITGLLTWINYSMIETATSSYVEGVKAGK